ncbi:MAG: hypothetical protein IJ039_01480 [Clostridia bacterium]|nr:hypothetical protein [Clostridia bacterium]
MIKLIKSFSLIILIAILALSIVGCGKVTENEALNIIEVLIKDAYELNEIYYGSGIKHKDSGNPNDLYMPAYENEKYALKNKLVERTYEVFSESYAESLIGLAFGGAQSEINQGSIQPRYMTLDDKYDGWIYVNIDYEPLVEKVAEYDFNSIKIVKISRRFIEATIKTTENDEVKVTVVRESMGWRLDSATC